MELFMILWLVALLVACDSTPEEPAAAPEPAAAAHEAPAAAGLVQGTVAEVIPAGGYTYLRLDTAGGPVWAAVSATEVAVGEQVGVSTSMPMNDFHSDTLNRDFALIYFAPGLERAGGAVHPAAAPAAPAAPTGPVTTTPPEGASHSVAQVNGESAALAGQSVTLRGEVVKFNASVMGKNWVHLKDGTGAPGTDDLTITTQDTVAVGDKVEVKGTVAVNQDFGYGYTYAVMVTDATVSGL